MRKISGGIGWVLILVAMGIANQGMWKEWEDTPIEVLLGVEQQGKEIEMDYWAGWVDRFVRIVISVDEGEIRKAERYMVRFRGQVWLPVPGTGCAECLELYGFEEGRKWIWEGKVPKYRYEHSSCDDGAMSGLPPWYIVVDRTRGTIEIRYEW